MSSSLQLALILLSSLIIITLAEPPHSSIPRSNNRYTQYSTDTDGNIIHPSSASDISSLSSPLNKESYHPPWNPSPKINSNGFLNDYYSRCPGEWEILANIRGKHGPRNHNRYMKLLNVPVACRQVPGDGNCLFHSIASCLYYAEYNNHLPMNSFECINSLRSKSLALRNAAVDILQNVQNNGHRRLFLQGEEYLEAQELLSAAAAQFDLENEEYCELMRKESYWGGGPEIVALCNYLQRPIHIYELIPTEEVVTPSSTPPTTTTYNNEAYNNIKTSNQFTLRRMACFGSPKFDRKEPLHILSADSRFPDVEPRRVRKIGNHFLALFPVNTLRTGLDDEISIDDSKQQRFRRHAMVRGGEGGRQGSTRADSRVGSKKRKGSEVQSRNKDKGLGSWVDTITEFFNRSIF